MYVVEDCRRRVGVGYSRVELSFLSQGIILLVVCIGCSLNKRSS